jgi:oligo-1,6-glucosidase
MTNVQFDSLDDYRDIETLNFYKERTESGVTHEQMMQALHENSRDNARTPMQWDGSKNAGFSRVEPWIAVNPNYPVINVEKTLAQPDSVFNHYQQLIALRKQHPAIVYGEFVPLLQEHDKAFAYLRRSEQETILVVNNFSADTYDVELPKALLTQRGEALISNYQPRQAIGLRTRLKPYESFAIRFGH